MPDFTQGKWIYIESAREIFSPATQADDDPFGLAIADIPFDPDVPEKEKHANGRLIAAAPEMYEALKECAEFVEDIICRNCEECSLKIDAEGLRDYIECIFARIDGSKEED